MHEPTTNFMLKSHLLETLSDVVCFAMDIDGVLTDGTIILHNSSGRDTSSAGLNAHENNGDIKANIEAESGTEQKSFHVSDGLGLVLLKRMGFHIVWISGRASKAVVRRASELGIENLLQGVRDKRHALETFLQKNSLMAAQAAYIGDDWNDLPAFEAVGVRIAVSNAADEVKSAADYVTSLPGGRGAVREVCMLLLEAHGMRDRCLKEYLISLANGDTAPPGQ